MEESSQQVEAEGASAANHGDVVIDALNAPTRLMIGLVLVINLTIGYWHVSRSDFTGVEPQGGDRNTQVARDSTWPQGEQERSQGAPDIELRPSVVALGEGERITR